MLQAVQGQLAHLLVYGPYLMSLLWSAFKHIHTHIYTPPHQLISNAASNYNRKQTAKVPSANTVSLNFLWCFWLVVVKSLVSSKVPITMLTAGGSHLQPGCLLATFF